MEPGVGKLRNLTGEGGQGYQTHLLCARHCSHAGSPAVTKTKIPSGSWHLAGGERQW